MNDKKKLFAVYISLIAVIIIIGVISKLIEKDSSSSGKSSQAWINKPVKYVSPDKKEETRISHAVILLNNIESIKGLDDRQIIKMRSEKLKQYRGAEIYPKAANPYDTRYRKTLSNLRGDINIAEGIKYYVVNPFLLIMQTYVNQMKTITPYCKSVSLKFDNNIIEETYSGESAAMWFYYVYSDEDHPGSISLWLANAMDAKYRYGNIDITKSSNIDLDNFFSQGRAAPDGLYWKENLSMKKTFGRLKLKEKDQYTSIYLKLWKRKPVKNTEKEDIAYIIKIIP